MAEGMQDPPKAAPYYPTAQVLKLPAKADAFTFLAAPVDGNGKLCSIPVQVGLFFDGTNNNLERDLKGKRIAVPLTAAKRKKLEAQARVEGKFNAPIESSAPKQKSQLSADETSHSNVARLYQAFPADKTQDGLHRFYIQGVGTAFPEIGEFTESAEGKAFAKGGEARIIWGIFQVLNAINMTLLNQEPLYKKDVLGKLVREYGRTIGQLVNSRQRDSKRVTHKDWFTPHLEKLKVALKNTPKPAIPSVTLSVFGFSRGGAEAVAFCHLLDKLLEGGCLVGIQTQVSFLGVFDVVASVGGSASVAKTLPMPGAIFDGHWSWANYVDEPLPGCVTKGVHLIAGHEMRMNFPVTRQRGPGMQEFLYPGSHSDVGGGYAPNEQGKARGGQGSLLSQIPLAHMYLAAREAGVPLLPHSEMASTDRGDFEVDANLASAWNAYAKELGEGGVLKSHMGLFYRWKAMRLTTLESTANFQAASEQDQEDLSSANRLLVGDLELLHHRKSTHGQHHDHGHSNQLEFGSEYRYKANQWQVIRANSHTSLDEWETFALSHFEHTEPLPDDVARFFDDHVHDSFATFYMAGEVTEFDKRSRVERVMDQDPSELKGFDKKIHQKTTKVHDAQAKQARGEELTAEETALVKEAEYSTPYPVMKDEDASDLLSWGDEMAVRTQSGTRREGGGYLVRRGYYPHSGFFIRRSVHEDELRKAAPKRIQKVEHESSAPAVYEWSNHLTKDIAEARKEQEELVRLN